MNWTRGHEIESDTMFDRFDGRRLVVDVVAVLLIGLRERSWRERERRKAPLAGMNSSCRHVLAPLWGITRHEAALRRPCRLFYCQLRADESQSGQKTRELVETIVDGVDVVDRSPSFIVRRQRRCIRN